jgi:hypothetical protein
MDAWLAFLIRLNRFSRILSLILLIAACGLCLALFNVRSAELERHAARTASPCPLDSLESPDSRTGGYDAATLDALFNCWGQQGRELYAKTQVSLDLVFPLAYGLLLGLLVLNLARAGQERLVLVPLLALSADLGENLLLAGLAWHGPPVAPALASVALACTYAKFGLLVASLALILVLAVRRLLSFLGTRAA